jgi:hypothetical protein
MAYTRYHRFADQQNIPLRTLDDVKADLAADHRRDPEIAEAMARLMLKHGRLTDEARNYVARQYPED